MPSVFTKIINGEIPCYKIYEDDAVIAFLDIHPESRGHTLVAPKKEIDKVYDLDDATYIHLMQVVKKLASHLEAKLGTRTIIKAIGVDVPHAHVHLVPYDEGWHDGREVSMTPEDFEEVRALLALSL